MKCCKKGILVGGISAALAGALTVSHLKNNIIVTSEVIEKEVKVLKGIVLKVKLKFTNNSKISFKAVGFKGAIYVGAGDKLTGFKVAPFELLKGTQVEKTITINVSWGEIVDELADLLKGELKFDEAYLQGFIKLSKLNLPIPYYQDL